MLQRFLCKDVWNILGGLSSASNGKESGGTTEDLSIYFSILLLFTSIWLEDLHRSFFLKFILLFYPLVANLQHCYLISMQEALFRLVRGFPAQTTRMIRDVYFRRSSSANDSRHSPLV